MRKQRICLAAALLLAVFALGLAPAASAAGSVPQVNAQAGNIDLTFNGTSMKLGTYNIANNNYVKLRDVAQLFSGTGKQFSVTWNGAGQRIDLTSGALYLPEGGELSPLAAGTQSAVPNSSSVWLNGAPVTLTAYTINQNNYFKLRDLGAALDFCVDWDSATGAVIVDTSKGYTGEAAPAGQPEMAKAMLAAMDQDLDESSFICNARLVDVDGDGIKDLITINDLGLAKLYYWADGQLQSKSIGAVVGGWCEWYLCKDTATGQQGIEYRSEGGGSFNGGTSTFIYSTYEVCISDYFYEGATQAVYYIGDSEATQAEHAAVQAQHQRLSLVLEDYDEQSAAHIAAVRAELAQMLNTPASDPVRDISDQELLSLAQDAVYEVLNMYFYLDVGYFTPYDESDYILHDEAGNIITGGVPYQDGWPSYRVTGYTDMASLEAGLRDIWYQKFSRKYDSFPTGSGYSNIYVMYNGALYVMENGMGDDGSAWIVTGMVSRTADEAVFSGYNEYSGSFTLSLVYEDGAWKYGYLD